jgi:hypothetical protein
MSRIRVLAMGAVLAAAAVMPADASAQLTSTIGPIIVIPSPFFTPLAGTVPVAVTPTVASAIVSAQSQVKADAIAGRLTSPITGVAIPAAVGQAVILMMTEATPDVRRQMEAALSQSGASGRVISQLMKNMPSLLSNPVPGQLQTCLSAFNGLINNANAAFLANPPAEFLGIHAVLLQISNAANAAPHPG